MPLADAWLHPGGSRAPFGVHGLTDLTWPQFTALTFFPFHLSIFFFKKKECISLDWRDWKNALLLSPLENFPGNPKMCLHVCFLWNPFTSPCKTPGSRLTVWKWVFCIETKKTNFCNKIEEAGDHLYEIKCGSQKRWGFCVLRGSWESWSECMTVTIRQRDWKIQREGGGETGK